MPMPVKITPLEIPEVLVVETGLIRDDRGFFAELYSAKVLESHGFRSAFLQDNLSCSKKGTLRGLHYQLVNPQGKLVSVSEGAVFDVAVDIRRGSPTFGRWVGVELSAENKRQLYIPVGFAHGFCVLSERAGMVYKCTDFYNPHGERGIIWNDPTIGIAWPVASPLLSPKAMAYRRLDEMTEELFDYRG